VVLACAQVLCGGLAAVAAVRCGVHPQSAPPPAPLRACLVHPVSLAQSLQMRPSLPGLCSGIAAKRYPDEINNKLKNIIRKNDFITNF
jgi:hypothetical protein